MAERPILFSAPMIRALLDGRKTQTRQALPSTKDGFNEPEYRRGDRLWVRETVRICAGDEHGPLEEPPVKYAADGISDQDCLDYPFKHPSIHMPRWASRLTLTVTDVRAQRLQEISMEDAIAEGIEPYAGIDPDCQGFLNYENGSEDGYWLPPARSFRSLWNSINGPDAWDANPWVAAYTFTVHKCNIEEV